MSHNSEISKSEQRRLAVASVTLGPWRTATVVGGLGGGAALGLGTIADGFGLGMLAAALSFALTLFFIVGGAGAVLGDRTAGPPADRRIRRWAAEHPWRVASVPGALAAAADLVVNQALTSQGFFGGVWDALWTGLLVTVVVGLAGRFARNRKA
ncbi:hypothetical protein [Streptomyces sp. NPDC020681]|uniref:hypothetical protein n=1 Tax=Streptomyces sp. NPDC020681 TaxID=3365083 RepID=UPI0037AC79FF